jgi:hypothetical protein
MENWKNPDIAAQFLIAEFNALQERAKNFEEIKASRVNFFLLVVAAAGAVCSAAAQINLFQQYYLAIISLTATVLLLLGISTLKHSVNYSGAIVILFRRAGRIRRWFVDFDEKIAPYVAFEPADDRPTFRIHYSLLEWRGAETVVMLFNVITCAVIIGYILLKIACFSLLISSIASVVVAVSTWFLQMLYVYKWMQNVESSDSEIRNTHFPYNEYLKKESRQQSQDEQDGNSQ